MMARMGVYGRCLVGLAAASTLIDGFFLPLPPLPARTPALAMNFFQDLVGKAFENDVSLDKDKRKGQYDGPYDGIDDDDGFSIARRGTGNSQSSLTETQQKWRETQQPPAKGSTTTLPLLVGSQWNLNLFLTGIPERDPSNDLFASRVNISQRDRKVGLAVPDEPTVSGILLTLLTDGACRIESESEFLDNRVVGAWKVSPDGTMIRICIHVLGYQRTVQTKGTIQKIYWSQEEDTPVQTSSAYTIPAGPLYGDAKLLPGRQVGTWQWNEGILQVEKSAGLLGAGSKMVPCGRFSATRVADP